MPRPVSFARCANRRATIAHWMRRTTDEHEIPVAIVPVDERVANGPTPAFAMRPDPTPRRRDDQVAFAD